MSTIKALGPLAALLYCLAHLPWQVRAIYFGLLLLASLSTAGAAITFVWRSKKEFWAFLRRMRYFQFGPFTIVMRDDKPDKDQTSGSTAQKQAASHFPLPPTT